MEQVEHGGTKKCLFLYYVHLFYLFYLLYIEYIIYYRGGIWGI
jgi:hypothetical protein